MDDVFARVLAKQPGDRYGSCREFIEATRAALGSLAAEPQLRGTLAAMRSTRRLSGTPRGLPPGPGRAGHEGHTMISHRQAAGAPRGEPVTLAATPFAQDGTGRGAGSCGRAG